MEGRNDCHVALAVAAQHGLAGTFVPRDCGNYEEVIKFANGLVLSADHVEVVGLVLDANRSIDSRWQAIRDRFKVHPYGLPDAPVVGGMVVEATAPKHPRLGLWIMPDNRAQGNLEDFCLQLADEESRVVAAEAVELAVIKGVTRFREPHRSKAVVHTYLAWQDEPGKPLGQSITSKALQPDHPIAHDFAEWLRRLFGEGGDPPPR